MILSDYEICTEVEKGGLVIDPFNVLNVQPASYDVTLGRGFSVLKPAALGASIVQPDRDQDLLDQDVYDLDPGEFLLGCTAERFVLPPYLAGSLAGKSSVGRYGVQVHATAGFIDPGFCGQLTLEISNLSDRVVQIGVGDLIGQVVFTRMSAPPRSPYNTRRNHYQGQTGPQPSRGSKHQPVTLN